MHRITPSLQLDPSQEGVLTLWIDCAERSVNVIDDRVLGELEAAIACVEREPRYRIVVIRSRKAGNFCVGADVAAIASLTSPAQVQAVIQRGQRLFERIAALPAMTLAVIDGGCMGGGLELAMACTSRIATDSPRTKFGLPEIRLGLIPGWGGTQRLPRLVGLRQALKMILSGGTIDAGQAKKFGLIERVICSSELDGEVKRYVEMLLHGQVSRPPQRSIIDCLLDRTALGRQIVLAATRRRIGSPAGHYPALLEATRAVGLSGKQPGEGYRFEKEAFTELLFTHTAQSLLGVFLQRDRAKKVSTWTSQSAEAPAAVARVAVIGAGVMGAGIGVLAAQRKIEVVFKEISDVAAQAGAKRVEGLLSEQVRKGRLTQLEMRQALQRISYSTNWSELSNCDMAIEAALEIESVKRDIFKSLDQNLPAEATLASNTSSLNVTQMAVATGRKPQVAGFHFFNPVDRMELVEVVRTEMTDDATVVRLLELARQLGKTPIVTSDKPGFLVNRVLFPYLGEAVRMVADGFAVARIDRELKDFGMPMGPLELIDQVGVDIASHVASGLRKIQLDADVPAAYLADMADRKWLGKKSRVGFYLWGKRQQPNPELIQGSGQVPRLGDFEFDGLTDIQRRLIYPLVNEAIHCLDEQVVAQPWMVDLGLVLGTGFAPHRGGPLRMADGIGAARLLHNMRNLEQSLGRRFAAADGLLSRASRGTRFFVPSSVSDPLAWESNDETRCTTES